MVTMYYYDNFSKWLDSNLERFPSNAIAANFNLYENPSKTYDIQLIGSDKFNETNDDWACEEIFSTEEDVFLIPRTDDIIASTDGLSFIAKLIKEYLEKGKYADLLKSLYAICIGFVDREIELIYCAG